MEPKPTYKKITIGLSAAIIMLFGDKLNIDEQQLEKFLYIAVTLLAGIGAQDFGKEAEKLKLRRVLASKSQPEESENGNPQAKSGT